MILVILYFFFRFFLDLTKISQDQYDTIDFTDNEISKLDNFPILKRLTTLIVHNNRVSRIADNIGTCLPNLEWLILNNNRIATLQDLEPLRGCKKLTHLSLLENPVALEKNYRLYVIHRLPKLRMLDFRKIKLAERKEATALFGELKNSEFVPGEVSRASSSDFTREQIEKIMEAIKNSKSAEEVQKYKRCLATGEMPPNLL